MRKIYVYAGYYELFITDKELPNPYVWLGTFDNMEEAEEYALEEDDYATHIIDADLRDESQYDLDDEDLEICRVADIMTGIIM